LNAPQFHKISDVPERLDWHLLNWRDYMRTGGTRGLGAPTKSAGFMAGGYNNDFDSMCLEADSRAAKAMDGLISSLTPAQSAAIHHRYLTAVYRFRDFEAVFAEACARLEAWMPSRGLV
jgi:hypothetical protein